MRVALRKALQSPNHRVRIAVTEYAPGLISEAERTAVLIDALEGSDTYGGLTQALLQIETFHPPEIMGRCCAAFWLELRDLRCISLRC